MSQFSDYTEQNILTTTLRGGAFPVPSGVYIALFTTDPTDAGNGAEVNAASWTTYVRVDAADGGNIDTGWTAPADGVSSNAKVITFPANNAGSSVTITHIGVFDASTAGNLLYHAPLVSSKTLLDGDVLSFAIGAITVTVA